MSRAPRWWWIALATATVLACSSTHRSLVGSRTAATASSAAAPPATATAAPLATGCGRPQPAGSTTMTVQAGGVSRTVIVHVPAGYTGATPAPLVLNLHGSGSTAAQQEALSGMDATADAHGFVVAYPQGRISSGTSGFDWNIPGVPLFGGSPVPAGAADDVAFLNALPVMLGGRLCIDAHRVYATGLSGGGRMSAQLACTKAGVFAAIAPVAGLRFPDGCAAGRPVPVIAFHGTADPVDPYQGNGQAYWTYSVPEAAQRWAAFDGCTPAAALSTPTAGVAITTYQPCKGGAAVQLYTLTGAGHVWPGGPPLPAAVQRLLGPPANAVQANEVMWAFFAAHPLP